jgi:hypothetical protein
LNDLGLAGTDCRKRVSTTVPQTIADVLLDLVASLESNPGNAIHEDDMVRLLESVVFGISQLSDEDKERLRRSAERKAQPARDPARRQFFADAPRVFRI